MGELTNRVVQYFVNDPLKLLYFVGGSGGILYWANLYRNRRRISVRLISETIELKESPYLVITSIFEVENLGSEVTSLIPKVRFSGYTYHLEKKVEDFVLVNEQRKLEPFGTVRLTFTVKGEAEYPFLYYRTYLFRLSRGSARRLRVRKEDKVVLGFFRFNAELARFLINRYLEMKGLTWHPTGRDK